MTMQGSGAISFSQIQTEFGGSNPISLSEYYRGGAYVGAGAPSVAVSGPINVASFYSSSAAFILNYTVNSPVANLNAAALCTSYGWNGVLPVILNLTNNSIIYESSWGTTALNTTGLTVAGSVVNLVNNSGCHITGMGGQGGNGVGVISGTGSAGQQGGYAIWCPTGAHVNITNNGYIWGGGGGGSGGNWYPDIYWTCTYGNSIDYVTASYSGGSGGGGCGYVGGASGTPGYGYYTTGPGYAYTTPGDAGYWAAGGGGGPNAGAGGGPGVAGGATYFSGGPAGIYLYGNSNVTWNTTGDVRGQLV